LGENGGLHTLGEAVAGKATTVHLCVEREERKKKGFTT
jgi:hypothetical protein